MSYTDSGFAVTFTGVDVPEASTSGHLALAIGPIAPNPAPGGEGRVSIAFALPAATSVTLAIYDAGGRLVRSLASGALESGRHSVRWDARDEGGAIVRPGVYWVRLEAMNRRLSTKLIVR